MKLFTKFSNVTFDEQTNTLSELLSFIENENKNMASKILTIYVIYYFISKLYKKNGSHFNKNNSLLGNNNFRFICISKANEVVQTLKNEITLFPYTFIDKVIRLVRETARILSKL